MIVEDDAVLVQVWRRLLDEAGHEATIVSNAETARKRLLASPYDVVVLDLFVGEESGLSVAAMASYSNPDCRVIVVTGSQLFARGELFAMTPNIATVMRKPVSFFELLAVMEFEATRARSQRAATSELRRLA